MSDDDTTEPDAPTYDAGGGPTVRAVTLGALSVPVAPPRIAPRPPTSPAVPPWKWVTVGFVLGVATTLAVLGAALRMAA